MLTIGSPVRHKIGGHEMTVANLNDEKALCSWEEGATRHRYIYLRSDLELIDRKVRSPGCAPNVVSLALFKATKRGG